MNVKTSEQINELAAALSKAQGAMHAASKDSTNPHFKSKYADLASVWDVCRKPLTDNGLSVVQLPEATEHGLVIATRLMHASGQWMQADLLLNPTKNDPQGVGSAITYGRRYGLCAMVGIVADEDDDGNGASMAARQQYEPRPEPQRQSTSSATDSAPANDATAFWTWARAEMKTGRFTEPVVRQALAAHHNNFAQARETLEKTSGQHTAA